MCTGMLDKNWIRLFYRSIGYPIEYPSKLYEENQETIKRVSAYRITTQPSPLDVLITALHYLHLCKKFDMVDIRSKMKLADINSKTHGKQNIRGILDQVIGICFYPTPVSEQYKFLCLNSFHGSTHHQAQSNDKPNKNNEIYSASLLKCIMFFVTIAWMNCAWICILHITMTMDIWPGYMIKERACVHLLPTFAYNSINVYHQCSSFNLVRTQLHILQKSCRFLITYAHILVQN